LYDIRAKWFLLGVELNVSDGTLNAIPERCNRDSDQYLYRMLSEWLKSGEATEDQLVKALRERTINEKRLADGLDKSELCSDRIIFIATLHGALIEHVF